MGKCSVCGEYIIWDNHKCKPKWYCIHSEDYGNDVIPDADYMMDEGEPIFASDAEKAAIQFAESYQVRNAWYPSEMEVLVIDVKETNIWKYIVNQEATPSYFVSYLYKPEIFPILKDE